jgi:DNA-binding transcriptional ArsR family regulator
VKARSERAPDDIDRALAALADPARRAVVDLLIEAPRRSSELADALAMSRPTMSRHLTALRNAGIVTERGVETDARVRVYELRPEPFGQLRGWLDEVEAFWSDQLAGFKAHVEARKPGRRRR